MAHSSSKRIRPKKALVKFLNPDTGDFWHKGDIHPETGKRFLSYDSRRPKGVWVTEESYQKSLHYDRKSHYKTRNPDVIPDAQVWHPENKWRRGDTHPETGLYFWSYRRRAKTTELWVSAKDFAARKLKAKQWHQQFREENEEDYKARRKVYLANERKRRKERDQEWRQRSNAKRQARKRHRYATEPIVALRSRIRQRAGAAFRQQGYTKKSKTFEMVGCTQEELFKHIEQQFTEGMSWDRFNEIEIDHIIPLVTAKTEEELIKLCHYTNLQPLWAIHNTLKGALMPEAFALLDLPPPPPPPDGLPVDFQAPTA